jgi:hypothetical protein
MSLYYQKAEAANLKVKRKEFSTREYNGGLWKEKAYHIMYSWDFPEYLKYKVLDMPGPLDENRYTTWGFRYSDYDENKPYYFELPADYEYPLLAQEVVAWLEKHYGNLPDVEDYHYMLNILEPIKLPKDYTFTRKNKDLAVEWLKARIVQAITPSSSPDELGIKWNVSRTQLVELVYALDLGGAITATKPGGREGMVERLGRAFGVEATSPVSVVASAIRSQRGNARRMPLLTKIMKSFAQWLDEEK